MILLVYAHPHHGRSIANRALISAARDVDGVTLHPLYDRYPDFSIDVAEEQRRLAAARVIVWQHPTFWYGTPALLQLWLETVLTRGFAYGEGGTALRCKQVLWVTTTGGTPAQYVHGAVHGRPFGDFAPRMEQTARFCGMHWLDPFVVHAAHKMPADELARFASAYRARLQDLVSAPQST